MKLHPEFKMFDDEVGSVEIFREDHIEKIFFQRCALAKVLTQADRTRVEQTVDRTTVHEKLADFTEKVDDLYETLVARSENLRSPTRRVLTNPRLQSTLRKLANIAALIINLLVILYSSLQPVPAAAVALFVVIMVLGGCLIAVMAFFMLTGFLLEFNIQMKTSWRHYVLERQKEEPDWKPEEHKGLARWRKFLALLGIGRFWMVLILLVSSILGVSQSPYWFCVQLFDLVIQSDTLLNVLRSITKNYQQLILTFVLILLVIYYYATFGYLFFSAAILKDAAEGEEQTSACSSVIECFVTVLAQFPSQGTVLMSALMWANPGSQGYWGFIYELTFFIISNVILLNIFFGIIVDTFSELREEKAHIKEDIEGRCFICGIDAATFDREGIGFRHHSEEEHNMWEYFHLYCALHELYKSAGNNETAFDGNQSHLWRLISNKDISFYPIGHSLSRNNLTTSTAKAQKVSKKVLMAQLVQGIGQLAERMENFERDLRTKGDNITTMRSEVTERIRPDSLESVDASLKAIKQTVTETQQQAATVLSVDALAELTQSVSAE
eukprot:GAFH01000903.1.p1 GENE.GAFH01000903.1~~GAFH01000903.1.p1  ORF type:complete len:554 (+),score=181.64 GAFH01000903.1:752-2413(+)